MVHNHQLVAFNYTTYYILNYLIGPGRLLQVVEHLQPECDRQANQILSEFRRSRQLDKQIRLVSEMISNR